MVSGTNDILREAGQALRAFRKSPGFMLTAVGTLGLAIGASAAIFTLVDTVLLDPLPYPDPDRLVILQGSAPGTDLSDQFGLSPEFLIQYKAEADLLESIASFNLFTRTLRAEGRVERVPMSNPSLSLFETLGVQPQIGRLPRPEEAASVALLSHELWMEWFGGDPNVIGRSYSISDEMRTVIGVMPPDFDFPREDIQVWFPSTLGIVDTEITPGQFGLPLVARVRPGVQHETLIAQLDLIASRLPEQYGGSPAYAEIIEHFTPRVVPLREVLLGPVAKPLWILLGATGILLMIACANVANLFLARAKRQRRDVAIRCAIGAPRRNVVRLQLVETTIVAILAGAVGVAVAALMLPAIVAQVPYSVPRLGSVELSWTTLLFTFGISVVAGFACGIVPAVRSAGVSLSWLRDGSRGVTRSRHWTRDGLVVAQAALALLLLVGSGLLLRSFTALRNVDPGYDAENILTFQMAPQQTQLSDRLSWANFHLAFMERLRGLPGVETVGLVENFPLDEPLMRNGFSAERIDGDADASEQFLEFTFVAGDYFRAMGIELLRGQNFDDAEHRDNPEHVIVSQSTAERLWPGEDPIGRRVRFNELNSWWTVIGVVEDVRQYGFRSETGPNLYFPLAVPLGSPAYVLRTSRAESIAPEVRELVREVAPEAPMYRIYTIQQLAAESMASLSFTTVALGLAAGLALLLGMVGLYSILSSTVAERTRELGIRIALGAEPGRVRRMVVGQGMRVVFIGVIVGIIGTLFGVQALESMLYGVRALDGVTLAATSVLMLLVGIAASWVPAYRASSVDPVETLADT